MDHPLVPTAGLGGPAVSDTLPRATEDLPRQFNWFLMGCTFTARAVGMDGVVSPVEEHRLVVTDRDARFDRR